MFEIKNDKIVTENKTFRMPKDLLERLEAIAQQRGISVNSLVFQCCEYALNDLKPEDKNKNTDRDRVGGSD